jgi:hypothetical protein
VVWLDTPIIYPNIDDHDNVTGKEFTVVFN